jgi:excisionase family DNA binding protein
VKGGSNRLMSAAELAEMLGVSVDTVYRNWRGWGLKGYRIGNRSLKFRDRDVENWIEQNAA